MLRFLHSLFSNSRITFRFIAFVAVGVGSALPVSAADMVVPPKVAEILDYYCFECHDADRQKGDVRFDNLHKIPLNSRLDLLNKMQEQVYFAQMPPKKKSQPESDEKEALLAWMGAELKKHNASGLEDKLRDHDYGNFVSHKQLFSGKIKNKPYTSARRWLVRPEIFNERVKDIFQLEGRARNANFFGVTNPFILPERSGIRDYDTTVLDGGHLLIMLSNAEWISYKQIRAARVKNGELKGDYFPNKKDRWAPNTTPKTFEEIILKKGKPTDKQLEAAIQTQFHNVLRRRATETELENYLSLTQSAIELGGNTEGIRQMLVSVILESEFLYRLEFGEGRLDQYGRRKLSPREASYAIAYAIGDRNPDPQLVAAAAEGRLETQKDYLREVTRLLADQNYYSSKIDPSIEGKQTRSLVVSHPRLIHFFRDFFGYTNALRVFKDSPRSGGFYKNPCRGDTQTPGRLVSEADLVLAHHVKQDQNVFENLLTTDEFFVYRDKDPETASKLIESWRQVYEKLKNTDWKTDAEKVLAKNLKYIKGQKSIQLHTKRPVADFLSYMYYFEESFGRGRIPFTKVPWAHGYNSHHTPFYSLPPTPAIGRYHTASRKNFKGFDKKEFWSYPLKQPFKIENRKGILTHPAWLIAHSQNTETDPVRRGLWVREKLLAGNVPDVPITVDAQIPEDHLHTLRTRLDSVTKKQACWKCHDQMNPLGLTFEIYDDFGRFRSQENLEHPENIIAKPTTHKGANTYKTKPVDATGSITGTGESTIDGDVKDALDMIGRLAKSDRVRQSIIRHAFRFFMGRNEMLSDSQTLIDAEKAYLAKNGSFKAVVISLLTSDSFIYRKPILSSSHN